MPLEWTEEGWGDNTLRDSSGLTPAPEHHGQARPPTPAACPEQRAMGTAPPNRGAVRRRAEIKTRGNNTQEPKTDTDSPQRKSTLSSEHTEWGGWT